MFAAMLLIVMTTGAPGAQIGTPPPPAQMPPNVYVLDASNPVARAICKSRGGSIVVMSGGVKNCVLPKDCKPWEGPQLLETEEIKPDTPAGRKACTDACGQLSTNPAGQVFCSKALDKTNGVRGWNPREPTN